MASLGKGSCIPVQIELMQKTIRTADFKIKMLGFEKEFTFMMSRKKSPEQLLYDFQNKLNVFADEIIKENSLDRNKIYSENHFMKNFKMSDLKNLEK